MGPNSQAAPTIQQPTTRDVVPKKTAPTAASPQPAALRAEIVADIPVKNPNDSAPTALRPIHLPAAPAAKSFIVQTEEGEDKDLDKVLQEVNTSVKKAENSLEARFEHLSGVRKKVAIKKAQVNEAHNGSPPVAVTIIAVLAAIVLSISAFMVYKKGSL